MKRVLMTGVILLATNSYADTLRCGAKLISTGDSKGSVENICGAPASTDSYCKPTKSTNSTSTKEQDCVRVDIWRYARGAGQLGAEVEFQMGEVTAIRNTERE